MCVFGFVSDIAAWDGGMWVNRKVGGIWEDARLLYLQTLVSQPLKA